MPHIKSFGKINDNDTGDIACDHYDKYEDDIKLMAELGISAYRFSISWTRIFPEGDDEIPNAKGLQFYDNLVNCCLKNGITPHITLFLMARTAAACAFASE